MTLAAATETIMPRRASVAAAGAPTAAEVLAYLPLVHRVVARFAGRLPPNVLRDDLVGAGTYGVIDSLRKRARVAGSPFEPYVYVRVRGAIVDELRAQDWLSRGARARATAARAGGVRSACEPRTVIGFDDLPPSHSEQADRSTPDPLTASIAAADRTQLRAAVASLPERERTIVESYYFKGVQLKVVAQKLGVSEPRVSQLHARAVARLRLAMGDDGARPLISAA